MPQKIAVVSYGMSDMIIPLAKKLSGQADCAITLFLIYARNKRKEGVVDFDGVPVETGFVPAGQSDRLISAEIRKYVNGAFPIRFFVYHNLKFRSLKNVVLSLQLLWQLRRFDVIHINGTDGTLLHLLPFLEFKKWLTTVHDLHPHSGEGRSKLSGKLERFMLTRAKRVIIQNKADYQYIEVHDPGLFKKTRLIPFGYLDVYTSFLQSENGNNSGAPIDILFFGRISKYKGLEYLLDALDLLRERGMQPRVVIGGGGDYDFGLERLKVMNNVEFINGYMENGVLADLIHRSKVIICPYTDATQSGVLMTAFAFDKPVIATAVGGFKEVLIDGVNGLLIPPKQPLPLADAMERLLSDSRLREEMGYNIRNYARLNDYQWENIARQYQLTYHQLN